MADWIDIIVRKRNAEFLEPEEIAEFVTGVQRDEIASEQAAALLMAVVLNGLDEEETTALAKSLMNSGQCLNFRDLGYPTLDVTEVGGIGGNAPLAAIPIAAAYGVRMPIIGDRSLGGFGGLLDKFESIPGFRADVALNEFQESVRGMGVAVIGQSAEMAPADTKINQLRTRTGTLGGSGLTVASLFARKACAGVRGVVAEIPCGSGGMAKNLREAHQLADDLVSVGEALGFQVSGYITNRDDVLGHCIGDVLELREAIEVLKGGGPEDLKEVVLNLAASLLVLGQLATDHGHGRQLAADAITDGRALSKLSEMVANQGGDTQVIENPENLPRGQGQRDIPTQRAGYIKAIDLEALGRSWRALGGSRVSRGDSTDHRVGIVVHKKVGDRVERGDVLATLHTSEKSHNEEALEAAEEAFLLSPEPTEKSRVILEEFGRRR